MPSAFSGFGGEVSYVGNNAILTQCPSQVANNWIVSIVNSLPFISSLIDEGWAFGAEAGEWSNCRGIRLLVDAPDTARVYSYSVGITPAHGNFMPCNGTLTDILWTPAPTFTPVVDGGHSAAYWKGLFETLVVAPVQAYIDLVCGTTSLSAIPNDAPSLGGAVQITTYVCRGSNDQETYALTLQFGLTLDATLYPTFPDSITPTVVAFTGLTPTIQVIPKALAVTADTTVANALAGLFFSLSLNHGQHIFSVQGESIIGP